MRAALALLVVLLLGAVPAAADGLHLIDRHKIRDKSAGFTEPSGLALAGIEGHLWSVSDSEALLHLMTVKGELKNAYRLPEDMGTDLEGVTVLPDGTVLLVQERDRAITVVSPGEPPALERLPLAEMAGYDAIEGLLVDNPSNKGLEGITADPASGTVFVVFEGRPRLLVTLSPDLKQIVAATPLTAELGFVSPHADDRDLDASGLAWSAATQTLWILSDTGRHIFVFDPAAQTVRPIDLSYAHEGETERIHNAEGIALDEPNNRLYIVTDDGRKSRLFEFELPAPM